jgi:hypothetical protein
MKDRSKESIDAAKHTPTHDATRTNRAVEKAARNPEFVDRALAQLAGFRFPAFKNNIIDHVKSINTHDKEDIVSLFESLDGYIQYRDEYQVKKAFEENVPAKKNGNQITDNTRERPDVRIRQTSADSSIKDREAVNESEERKDYPEVAPTAMSNFTCDKCGKEFQNQQDLLHHREFESGTPAT